jgi:hypothetical protein
MSILFLLAQAAAEILAAAPASQPVVIQSLCVPEAALNARNAFIFELIQTDGKWSNRLVPVEGSLWPIKTFAVSNPRVDILPSPRGGRGLMNTGSSEFDGSRYFFVAVADIPERELTDFSVDLTKGISGKDYDSGPKSTVSAKCHFTNKPTVKKSAVQ